MTRDVWGDVSMVSGDGAILSATPIIDNSQSLGFSRFYSLILVQ